MRSTIYLKDLSLKIIDVIDSFENSEEWVTENELIKLMKPKER
jgi:hypothetical protein